MTKVTGITTVIILIVIIALAYLVYQSTTSISEPEEVVQEEQEIVITTLTLEVASSGDFNILLEANIATGYTWQASFDQKFVQLNNQEYITDIGTTTKATTTDEIATSTEEKITVDQKGQEKFEFTALRAGQTDIIFTYSKPWETVEPFQTIIYQITIIDESTKEGDTN